MALARHDAAGRDQRRRPESEFVGAEESGDDDVASGLEAAVYLQTDAIAQSGPRERLMRFGEAELPRRAGVPDRSERRRARAAVVTADLDRVRVRLGHAYRNRPD